MKNKFILSSSSLIVVPKRIEQSKIVAIWKKIVIPLPFSNFSIGGIDITKIVINAIQKQLLNVSNISFFSERLLSLNLFENSNPFMISVSKKINKSNMIARWQMA